MYRFRVMFELSEEQIKKYIRYYERRRDWPVTLFLALSAAIFLFLTLFSGIIGSISLKAIICAVIIVVFLIILLLFKVIRLKLLRKKPPFAIGPYLSMEIRDGYFNVNCSGVMKGFPRGYLNGKITKKGDYVLTNKKDIIVIPKDVLTQNMANEIKEYYKWKNS